MSQSGVAVGAALVHRWDAWTLQCRGATQLGTSLSRGPFLFHFDLSIDYESSASQGLECFKSRPHLLKGAEGVAWQAAQKEVVLAKKKKRTMEV